MGRSILCCRRINEKGLYGIFNLRQCSRCGFACSKPRQNHFTIDVKGQSTKNFWLIQRREYHQDHYFVLVYVDRNSKNHPKYFIASSPELMGEREKHKKHIESKSGKYRDDMGGINWSTALQYEDKWETLPK